MKIRTLISMTLILLLAFTLVFNFGCTTSDEPSTPGGELGYVGTWAEIEDGWGKEVYIFTINTFVNKWYDWIEGDWVLDDYTLRGSLSVTGGALIMTVKEVSYDGSTWFPHGPFTLSYIYSISGNQLTLRMGDWIGVYTKQ